MLFSLFWEKKFVTILTDSIIRGREIGIICSIWLKSYPNFNSRKNSLVKICHKCTPHPLHACGMNKSFTPAWNSLTSDVAAVYEISILKTSNCETDQCCFHVLAKQGSAHILLSCLSSSIWSNMYTFEISLLQNTIIVTGKILAKGADIIQF